MFKSMLCCSIIKVQHVEHSLLLIYCIFAVVSVQRSVGVCVLVILINALVDNSV